MTDEPIHGCTGKTAFATKKQAATRAKQMRRKYHNSLAEYHCPHCHAWHIGELDSAGMSK